MNGPEILARTISVPRVREAGTPPWQYHPRSDHHSKVACWTMLLDLLQHSDQLCEHVASGKVAFGINHVMVDFTNNKKKALDLVVCRPREGEARRPQSFRTIAATYGIHLSSDELRILHKLPDIPIRPVGSVLVAVEAKAAMTEFAKARPRLYSELQDSHVTVHGDTTEAIAVGFAMINGSETFVSPTANPSLSYGAPLKISKHDQPRQLQLTVEHLLRLPRRSDTTTPGFDAFGVIAVNCRNDNESPVTLITTPPAPQPGDGIHYDSMIGRITGLYATRFKRG